MPDPLAGAVLGPIGATGADPLAGATLAPVAPAAPEGLLHRIGREFAMGALPPPGKAPTDPTGQGRPLPAYAAAAEDVVGGALQGAGAAIGEAAGPFGAMAGAGAGAAADDILNAKVNQQLYGWGYKPTKTGLGMTALLGGLMEGAPRAVGGIQRAGMAGTLTKAGQEAAEGAEGHLFNKELPARKAEFEKESTAIEEQTKAAKEAAEAKARGEVAKNMIPKAAQMELENFVGRTPAEREAARNAPELWFARRRAQMADNTVWRPLRKMGEEFSEEYERSAPQELMVKPAGDLSDVTKDLDEELDKMREKGFGAVSPRVAKLTQALSKTKDSDWGLVAMNDTPKTATQMLKNDPQLLEARANEIRDLAQQEHDVRVKSAQQNLAELTRSGGKYKVPQEMIDKARQQVEEAQAAPLRYSSGRIEVPEFNNSDLMTLRRLASSLVGSEDGPSSHAAAVIGESLDKKLAENGIRIPADLQMRYGTYKNVFDRSFRRNVATATHPEEYAHEIFMEPRRFNSMFSRMDNGGKVALRKLFGDWAVSLGPDGLGKQIADGKLSPSVPRALFGDTPYARLQPWIETDAKSMGWEKFWASAPPALRAQAEQQAKDAMQSEMQKIASKRAAAYAGAGRDLARKLGPAGAGILATMKGMSPEAAAQYVEDTFGKVLGDVPEPLPPTGTAEMQRYRESKAIQQGLDLSAKRKEAAVNAILDKARNGDPDIVNFKRRQKWYLPLLGFLGLSGHVSPYIGGAAAYSTLGSMLFGPRQAFLKALSDPETARLFYEGIKPSANALNATKPYARKMGEAVAHLVARSLTQQAVSTLGLSAGVPPEDKGEAQ